MELAGARLFAISLFLAAGLSTATAAQRSHGADDAYVPGRPFDLHGPETGVGTVQAQHKLPRAPGFSDTLDAQDYFGRSVTVLGDLDDDGVVDLAVGATGDSDGASQPTFAQTGAVWILFLDANGTVRDRQKINELQGGFTGNLHENDGFGCSLAGLGDLDGDGIEDLAVGALGDDDGSGVAGLGYVGAVWILFLNADGTVRAHQKISATNGGFGGTLGNTHYFGTALATLDDLDGDGIVELAVGAFGDSADGPSRGAVWVLFLNADGTVEAEQKISASQGGFTGVLDDDDRFGTALASPGDLDGDGTADLAVGAVLDDDGGNDRGALWVLFLASDATVSAHQKISSTAGGFTGVLGSNGYFGGALGALGDLDGDGVRDLCIGAANDTDGGSTRGAAWVLFLNADGTVAAQQKVSDTQGNFDGGLERWDDFGAGVVGLGDLDGDGVRDLAVGAGGDDDGGDEHGAVWVLFLEANGTVDVAGKISDAPYGIQGTVEDDERFGSAVALLGDVDGDGVGDMAVGAPQDDDGGDTTGVDGNRGAVWILFLNADGSVKGHQQISSTEGRFWGVLSAGDYFGTTLAAVGDLDFDGISELAVGATGDDDGSSPTFATGVGAVWILFLDDDGTVKRQQKISDTQGGFAVDLPTHGEFGSAIAGLGDLDGDSVNDIIVGSPGDNLSTGALWVLFLRTDGTVKGYRRITAGEAGFTGTLSTGCDFGSALALLPGSPNGRRDLAVGASGDDEGDFNQGVVWLLRIDAAGTVRAYREIGEGHGAFDGELHAGDFFGSAVAGLGDLDGNGIGELAVGAHSDDNGGAFLSNRGAVWVLFLDGQRNVIDQRKITEGRGGFLGDLSKGTFLGRALAAPAPGSGAQELWVGAPGDHDEGFGHGAVWSLTLDAR